jgi:hypothetical protein
MEMSQRAGMRGMTEIWMWAARACIYTHEDLTLMPLLRASTLVFLRCPFCSVLYV